MAPVAMAAAGMVTILAVVLIVAALVVYLVSVIVQLRKITNGLDEVIVHVGEIVQKSAPVNGVVTAINEQLDAGVDLLEGLLVKKAGMADAVGLVEGLYAGSAAAGFRSFPESATVKAPRIGEVYTRGTLTLARLGREAPIAVGNPAGPALRDVERGSLAARLLYPEGRQTRPASLPRSPVIGTGAPVQYPPSEQRGGTTPDTAEIREKGPWAETAAEGIVPAELGGSDAPRELLAEDPQLGSSVLGETTGSDEPATASGIDPHAGDAADATSDGGPDLPEGAEPDLKDAAAAAPREVDVDDKDGSDT
ncbi:MAG TPA: hypothetical protein VFT18_04740 [Gaiellaceae bacterium]|nr:hypothetical protein [Gaiellaceae bacterium]